jgi:hypothetical protein
MDLNQGNSFFFNNNFSINSLDNKNNLLPISSKTISKLETFRHWFEAKLVIE